MEKSNYLKFSKITIMSFFNKRKALNKYGYTNYMLTPKILFKFLLFILISSCLENDSMVLTNSNEIGQETFYKWSITADDMQAATYKNFLSIDGTFITNNKGNANFQYLPNAHALHILVDGFNRTKDASYVPKMKALIKSIKIRNGNTYQSVSNNHMLWLANSCVSAFLATNDEEYKDIAEQLWETIKRSHNNIFGGGISLKKNSPKQKNAVSNSAAIILATRLYELDKDPEDLDWAKKLYNWEKTTLVDSESGCVWDNISEEGVVNTDKDWVFAYSMGAFIGAGVKLFTVTDEQVYLNDALKSANAVITNPKLNIQGILSDEGQGDAGLFKGILVRYFTELILQLEMDSSNQKFLVDFLKMNAETFYNKGLHIQTMLCSSDWTKPPIKKTDLTTQLSGVILMEAATKLKQKEIF